MNKVSCAHYYEIIIPFPISTILKVKDGEKVLCFFCLDMMEIKSVKSATAFGNHLLNHRLKGRAKKYLGSHVHPDLKGEAQF